MTDIHTLLKKSQAHALRSADSHTDLALRIRLTEHLVRGEVPLALDEVANKPHTPT